MDVISYAETDDSIDKILVDKICVDIYNDVSRIYFSDTHDKEALLQHLIEKYDKHYLVYYYLGYYYGKMGNIRMAIACYKICISIHSFADAYLNLGIIYQKQANLGETRNVLQRAVDNGCDDVRILNFVGAVYYIEKDYYRAIEHYKKIILEHPTETSSIKNVYNNIGFSYSAIGECELALQHFDTGLGIICRDTPEVNKLNVQLLQNKLLNYDYMYANPQNVFDEFLKINTYLKTINTCKRKLLIGGKIRIGYISPDLRQHVCAYFIEPLLKYFDKTKFEVFCYANVENEDNVSKKFRSFDGVNWFNIYNMPSNDVCHLIHTHRIDVLVDLAGHTNGNRLDVMALKPAPIQITYLGYPNTTGLTNVDYRITDRYADPITSTQKYTEKLIYMPRCFVCYTISPILTDIPIKKKNSGVIVFGVMNKLNKHNKLTFDTWNAILQRVPNSILLIKRDIKSSFDIRIKYLKQIGLTDDRIKIVDYISGQRDYYELYNDVDICLDTFPYSGTTTSCDALQMSTPIITLNIPNRHVSNVTTSMLTNIGCQNLVARSLDKYVELAVSLANDREKINQYKSIIRDRFIELMDTRKFVREFDKLIEDTCCKHE